MASVPENEGRTTASTWAHVLQWLVCFNLYAIPILGSIFVAVGLLSFFVDLGDSMWLGGEPVRRDQQKIRWTVCSAALSALGLAFVWLHRKRYLRFRSGITRRQ